ncbi:hypothetical protein IM763_02050 [Atopobiaceae bacterium FL090493]|nr:hypothetical protein [Atopobiaceae bacterium FL090493]
MEDGRTHVLMSLLAIYNENDSGQLSHAIAEYLLTHFESIGSMSLQEVMDAGFVSRSGLRRFCQSIGVENFSSLRNQAGEWEEFRHYYLAAASSSSEYQVPVRQAMVEIFDSVDRLRESGALRRLSRLLRDSEKSGALLGRIVCGCRHGLSVRDACRWQVGAAGHRVQPFRCDAKGLRVG